MSLDSSGHYRHWKHLVRGVRWEDAKNSTGLFGQPCPQCHRQLTVYTDFGHGTRWAWCQGCQWAGDCISLLAAWFGQLPETAIDLLAAQNLIAPRSIDLALLKQSHGYTLARQAQLQGLWSRCQNLQAGCGLKDISGLLKTLKVGMVPGTPEWDRHQKDRLGAADGVWLKENLTGEHGNRCIDINSVYLVTPIERLPGQFSGLMVFDYHGMTCLGPRAPNTDISDKARARTSGWVGLRQAIGKDNCQWLLSGDVAAIRRWIECPGSILSGCSSYGERDRWLTLSRVVSGGPATPGIPNTEAIAVAKQVDRPLTGNYLTPKTEMTISWMEWLNRICQSEPGCVDVLRLSADDRDRILGSGMLPLSKLIKDRRPVAETKIGPVEDRHDGWYVRGERVSDVRIVIEYQVLREASADQEHRVQRLQGRIIRNDKAVTFSIRPTETLWLEKALAAAGELPPVMTPMCRRYCIGIAEELYPPELVRIHPYPGYYRNSDTFVFNGLWVTPGGQLKSGTVVSQSPKAVELKTLGQNERIGELLRLDCVLTAVSLAAAGVLASASGRPFGWALHGDDKPGSLGLRRISRLLRLLGCRDPWRHARHNDHKNNNVVTTKKWLKLVAAEERRRGVPTFVASPPHDSRKRLAFCRWLTLDRPRHAIAYVHQNDLGLLAAGRWQIVQRPNCAKWEEWHTDSAILPCLVPEFIGWWRREKRVALTDTALAVEQTKAMVKVWAAEVLVGRLD